MKKMERFPEKNPNPVMSVKKDGTILYSNVAGEPLLQEWGVGVGEKIAPYIGDFVQKVISQNSPEKMEVKAGKRVYLVKFHPLPEEECVNLYGFDISDQKELEGKLQENEAREMGNLELAEIIDPQAIQSLMEDFYKLAYIPMSLEDLKGNILVGIGWQDICTKFHRVHPETCKHCIESDTELSTGVLPGESKLYKCKNNMWDITTPIIVDDQHVGNIFSGQFFFEDEPLDYELFRSHARKYGFNEEEYIAALEKVPMLSPTAVNTGMALLTKLANMISQLSYSNIKLAQSLAERDDLVDTLRWSEKRYHLLFENMLDGFAYCKMIYDDCGHPVDFIYLDTNSAFERLTGLKGVTGKRVTDVIPRIMELNPELFDIYGRVALTGQPERFEIEFKPLGIWLCISVYSPEREHFVAIFDNITERKRAEETARQRLVEIEDLYSNAPVGLCVLDRELRFVRINERLAEINGIPAAAHIGKRVRDLMPHLADEVEPEMRRILETGQLRLNIEIVSETPAKPGVKRSWLEQWLPITDSRGCVTGLSIVVEETTERKRAEDALRESEERLLLAQKVAKIGTFEWNIQTGVNVWTPELEAMYGLLPGEFGKTQPAWEQLVHPDDRPNILRLMEHAFETGEPVEGEWRVVWPDGSVHWLTGRWQVFKDAAGQPLRMTGVNIDITERKWTEEILRLSEEKFSKAFATNPAAISVTRLEDGLIMEVNDIWLTTFGYSRDEVIGTSISLQLWPKPEDRARIVQELREKGSIYGREMTFLRRSGEPLTALVSAVILNVEGKELVLSTWLDITERKRAEDALLQKEKELNEAQRIAHVSSWYWDAETDANIVSDELLRIFGQACPPFKEQKGTMYPPESWERLNAAVQKAVQTGVGYELDLKALHGDGHAIWITTRGEAVRDANGVIIGLRGTVQDITGRKHAEKEREQLLDAVQQEKDRLAALINSITDEVWFADTQKNFTLVNPSGLREFSICAEEKIEVEKLAAGLEVYRPDGSLRPVEEAPPLRALRGEVVKNQEEIIRTPVHGELRYRLVSAAPVHDIGDNIIGSVSIVRDITESKKAGEKIQNLANIVESSNDAIITKSLDDIITSWNKGAEQIYGYSAREVMGKPISIIEPDSLKGEIEQLGEMIKQGDKIHNYETLRLRKDGTIINVSITLSPVIDASGKLTAISAITRDITERKRAEEKLRESEEKYRNIVEAANEGIIVIDDEAIVTYANKKMADMFGYTLEEGINRPIWDFINEECKAIVKLNIEKRRQGTNGSYELKLIRKDGSSLWVLVSSKSLFDTDGKFKGSMSMLTDITKRKEAEEILSNIEIARKKEIHHRIKNNLQVISSLLDLQAEKFNNREDIKDSEVMEAFRESQDRVISMALIHEDLYKGGGIDTLDFSSYIHELTENLFLTYRLGNINISLNMDLEENLFFDMDTAVPLGMIVNELVSNSLKHAFIGRDRGEIRINLCREENGECINGIEESKNEDCKSTNFTLTVSDNGVGIPENIEIEDLDTLGFQLVTSLVDQLDGELKLKRNNGTEFIMRFTVTEKE